MIGYYVHHQGRGHLHRALAVAAQCEVPVTGLSSLGRPAAWRGAWIQLPRDDDGRATDDPTAHGRLHWAPVHHRGLGERMATIAGWLAEQQPALLVSDVSVEVTLLARLLGTPVVVAAMRGDRRDAAHQLGYDVADTLLAPWPAALPEPGWPDRWLAKTVWTGGFSRFDNRPRTGVPRPGTVLLMLGAGGHEITGRQVDAARRATPGWRWELLGQDGNWTADPWPQLTSAEVVVTHGGQNAVAECAAARRPAVIVPQPRPFGEQHATARALDRAGLAVAAPDGWPASERWPTLLSRAAAIDGQRWSRYAPGDGARRAARTLDALARNHRDRPVRTEGPA